MFWRAILIAILLAGCAQLPLTPADLQARKFETVPDKSVIYVVRDSPDFIDAPATIWLGEQETVTIYPGTYYRWETVPGLNRIKGMGADGGAISLKTIPGGVYFVQQRLTPSGQSAFQVVGEPQARSIVARSTLAGGR